MTDSTGRSVCWFLYATHCGRLDALRLVQPTRIDEWKIWAALCTDTTYTKLETLFLGPAACESERKYAPQSVEIFSVYYRRLLLVRR